MDAIKDMLIGTGATIVLGIVISLLTTWIKKGQFHKWGYSVGVLLDKFGMAKFGKLNWEKFEDVITTAVLSFAQGIKDGADWDDNEVSNLIVSGNRNGVDSSVPKEQEIQQKK